MHESPMIFLFREGIYFIKEIYRKRYQIIELTRRDFKQRYIGSFLGLFWAFLEPLALILIMWFVFTVGFRSSPSGDVPFVVYLFTGMIAFNFFNETVNASSSVIRSYSFLVRKVNFTVSVLPVVKLISSLVLHLIFIAIVLCVLCLSGFTPNVYWIQSAYYLGSVLFLMLGLGWLLSALGVFVRDISHIVLIFLRLTFWATPIFWNINMLPEKYRIIIMLNPLYYIVQGYRESFIYHVPFWNHTILAAYFWCVSTLLLVVGAIVFKRLMPHFADVL